MRIYMPQQLRINFRSILLFLLSTAWFAFLIPWTGFADPDAYYHAKLSLLLWQSGPIHAFPWLDLTQLGTQPADLHFLFHAIVAPFVAHFGLLNGLRVASVLLCSLGIVTFDFVLRRFKIAFPLMWVALLLSTQPYLFRMVLGKASPLALMWFMLGICAVWLRRPLFVGVASLAFALSHAGWPYLVGSIVLMMIGDVAYRKIVVEEGSLWRVVRGSYWREWLASIVGVGIGLVVHPNFPHNVLLSWTQIVTIGLGTPFQHIQLGAEWLPADPSAFLSSFASWVILLIAGILGFFFAPKKPFDGERARLVVVLAPIVAALFALSLKSQRNVEYLAPTFALFCAVLWSLIDVQAFRQRVQDDLTVLGRWARITIPPLVVFAFGVLLVREVYGAWHVMHPPTFLDTTYVASMREISSRAKPGDRVFHSSWDEFPLLFAADDRLRYISGLDPTFLYVASSTLSNEVRDVTTASSSTTPEQVWSVIHDQTHSRFVFVSKRLHEPFLKLIESDSRYRKIADTDDSAAFEVLSAGDLL